MKYDAETKEILNSIQYVVDLIKEHEQNRNENYDNLSKNGTICPKCFSNLNYTIDSRNIRGYRIRRRECKNCHRRWQTVEVMY